MNQDDLKNILAAIEKMEGGLELAPHRKQQQALENDVREWLGGKAGEEAVFGIFSSTADRPKWYHRDLEEPFSKESLFEGNENGMCYLDAPDTWHAFADVVAELKAQGQSLTKEDLLRKGGDGCSFLEQAARSGAFDEVAQYLEKQGEPLKNSDLMDDGKPNGVLKAAVAWGQHAMLFAEKRWEGHAPQEYSQLASMLPPSARSAVGHIHATVHRLREQQQDNLQSREEMGR